MIFSFIKAHAIKIKIKKNKIMINMHSVVTLTLGSRLNVKSKGP
jgi:hypothetical protein